MSAYTATGLRGTRIFEKGYRPLFLAVSPFRFHILCSICNLEGF